jgi:uncharacterized protein
MSDEKRAPNRLAKEASPYLRQHALNPVDWYPWGPDALNRARREQKPIFLSIGYSACHWCHVMERESFEDGETAALLNQHFVSIKVDREERPDLDHIYMTAVQAMTQRGGWPMSVFLTPDQRPFYGGTYFPPVDRMGMPSFKKIILGVANAWTQRKDEVLQSAGQLMEALKHLGESAKPDGAQKLSADILKSAVLAYAGEFDPANGGFGGAPKFFHTMDLRVVLRHWAKTRDEDALEMVTTTLDHWSRGGIYDHLGGGFHRYSTDPEWLAPHFEKMLYDNALVAECFLEGYQATKNPHYAQVARETLDYVIREMRSEDGTFFSTQDADTEGEEGRFYVWTKAEILAHLDRDVAESFAAVYDVTASGNWEGKTILRLKKPLSETAQALGTDLDSLEATLAVAKRKLLEVRARRVAPFRDEKVLASWNGLMIDTLAKAAVVLGDPVYGEAAKKAMAVLWEKLFAEGRLLHQTKDGFAMLDGYLDDHACLANACVSLFEMDGDVEWIGRARALMDEVLSHFWDGSGGFHYTRQDHEKLILRPRDNHDGATPSGSSMAVTALLRLGNVCGDLKYLLKAEAALKAQEPLLRQIPRAAGQLVLALDFYLGPPEQVYVVEGESREEFETCLDKVRSGFSPRRIVGQKLKSASLERLKDWLPMAADKTAQGGKTTVYVCERFSCQKPLVGETEVEAWTK